MDEPNPAVAYARPASFQLRPMGVGDILDVAFRLYRTYFVPFVTIGLIAYVPYTIVMVLLHLLVGGQTRIVQTQFGPQMMADPVSMLLSSLSALLFLGIVLPIVQGAMIISISSAYLGESVSAGAAYRRAMRRMWPMIGTQIIVGLVVGVGFLLCIVPGVIFALWYLMVMPVVFLEELSGSAAMSRSKALMKDNLNKGFAIGLMVVLLVGVIQVGAFMTLSVLHLTQPAPVEIFTNLIGAALLPFQLATTILLYYDLRIRKEAFDLQRLSESLPAAVTPA